jgi:hypothetical protein
VRPCQPPQAARPCILPVWRTRHCLRTRSDKCPKELATAGSRPHWRVLVPLRHDCATPPSAMVESASENRWPQPSDTIIGYMGSGLDEEASVRVVADGDAEFGAVRIR